MTGFIVNDVEQAVAAVRALDQLDRREVRRRFDRRSSATAMARAYLDVYADRLAKALFAADLIDEEDLERSILDPDWPRFRAKALPGLGGRAPSRVRARAVWVLEPRRRWTKAASP